MPVVVESIIKIRGHETKIKLVKCPKRGKMAGPEVPRRWRMYLIPWTKNYYCVERCHEFAILFGKIAV